VDNILKRLDAAFEETRNEPEQAPKLLTVEEKA
jgi:hypothetical protein